MGLGAAAGTRRRLYSVTLESKPPGLGAAWRRPCMDSCGNETRLSGARRRPFSALPPILGAGLGAAQAQQGSMAGGVWPPRTSQSKIRRRARGPKADSESGLERQPQSMPTSRRCDAGRLCCLQRDPLGR